MNNSLWDKGVIRRSCSRSIHAMCLFTTLILLIASSPALCMDATRTDAASTKLDGYHPSTKEGQFKEEVAPFLRTLPPANWQNYNNHDESINSNSRELQQQKQPEPSMLHQSQQKHQLRRLPEKEPGKRRNIRRREYKSARGKHIDRALKHHTRMHTIGPIVEEAQVRADNDLGDDDALLSLNQSQIDLPYYDTYPAAKVPKHVPKVEKASKGKNSYYKIKGTTSKLTPELAYDEIDEEYLQTYPPDDYHYAAKKSKSKGKKGKKGHHKSKSAGEVRYFEANILLEMKSHDAIDLSPTDVQQLESVVLETYNHLTSVNCDLQGRTLVAVNADPTPTSTGIVLHLQGQCYNCDPANVRVFAHPDEVFDSETGATILVTEGEKLKDKEKDKVTKSPEEIQPPDEIDDIVVTPNGTTPSGGGAGNSNSTNAPATNLTGGGIPAATPTTGAPVGGGNVTAPPGGGNATARNRGVTTGHLLPKKIRTASKLQSRLQRSEDYEEEEARPPPFNYGVSAEARARYNHNQEVRRLHDHATGAHAAVNRDPEYVGEIDSQEGVNVNRGPVPDPVEDRGEYETLDFSTGLVYPSQPSKKTGVKGLKSKESKLAGKGKGYHPVVGCENEGATLRAPTEEEFVTALNFATDTLLAQYNKLSVRSALQVRPLTCDATEEAFNSSLVVVFLQPETPPETVSPTEINLIEETILQSYNHLQAALSCDVPYFREMTDVVLKGFAPGADEGTVLAMFMVNGTCRGVGCSDGATFFDPLDEDERKRRLQDYVQTPSTEFTTSFLSESNQYIGYDTRGAHVYHEQCYCPMKIEEFGPPFVSEMEAELQYAIQNAFELGTVESVVSVLDIVEVPDDGIEAPDDETANDPYVDPTGMTEELVSFVIVQFFGTQDAVYEAEINAIEDAMPQIYQDLQEKSFCDSQSRVLDSAVLQTVDAGPTPDSFLLGFFLMGTCQGNGCNDAPMFFAPSGEKLVPCGGTKVEGPPLIDDFENNLATEIMELREEGAVVNIQASGEVVEVVPGSPSNQTAATVAPAPAPTSEPTTKDSMVRTQMLSDFQGRKKEPAPIPAASASPTSSPWPTWLDTDYPTFKPKYKPTKK